MRLNLTFISNKKTKRSKKKSVPLISVKTEHTPIDIINMDNDDLIKLYQRGNTDEKDMADEILNRRRRYETAMSLPD